MELNQEQHIASNAPLGYNLVIASAGTGKTSTIVGRIAFLLQQGVNPSEILLLTFTNKASFEMISRVARIFDKQIANSIESGTFHSVAYRYLKAHKNIILKQPRELKILLKGIYERRRFNNLDTKEYTYQYLYELYSLFSNMKLDMSFSEWLISRTPEQEIHSEVYEGIMEEFNDLKRKYNYADYNDLLILYREELENNTKNIYTEVLCDEYQDTNPLQNSIIEALKKKSLFCVGDYDQSIYAFNGADISIIENFSNNYPNSNIFSLIKNYRSGKYILDLANKVISNNPRSYKKELVVGKEGQYYKPCLLEYDDVSEQYMGIAEKIYSMRQKIDISYSDFAIIYRNNSSADGLETFLRKMGIDSKRKGSGSIFSSKEVEFLLCLYSVIVNPKDMMGFIYIISQAKGIGNTLANDIFEALMVLGNNDCKKGLLSPNLEVECYVKRANNSGVGLFDEFFRKENRARFDSFLTHDFKSHPILEHGKITRDAAIFLDDFFRIYKSNIHIKQPDILLKNLISSKIYNDYAEKLILERSKIKDKNEDSINKEEVKKVRERIETRLKIIHDISKNYKDLYSFLNAIVLGGNEMGEGSGVNLLSVHASKGLEFKCVFVVDLMEGRFPNIKLIRKSGSVQEERMLFYVSVTRAKDYLFLSYANNDKNKDEEYIPSRFLAEGELINMDLTKYRDEEYKCIS